MGAGGQHHLDLGEGAAGEPGPVERGGAGLTGYVAGTSRAVARFGVTINNLLPGSHDTDRIRSLDEAAVRREGITHEEVRRRRLAEIPAGRMGTPQEFGAMCAFLCSAHAGYVVGQNIALDGGSTNLTL